MRSVVGISAKAERTDDRNASLTTDGPYRCVRRFQTSVGRSVGRKQSLLYRADSGGAGMDGGVKTFLSWLHYALLGCVWQQWLIGGATIRLKIEFGSTTSDTTCTRGPITNANPPVSWLQPPFKPWGKAIFSHDPLRSRTGVEGAVGGGRDAVAADVNR